MKPAFLLFCILFILGIGASFTAEAQVDVNDSLALVDFYNSTNGPNWYQKNNWLTGPVKNWFGVRVSSNGTRVIQLGFSDNNLVGHFPPSFANLTRLNSLSISRSVLDSLPSLLGNLTSLTNLTLTLDSLSGHIPESLGSLSKLQTLSLSGNYLSGNIPSQLGSLDSLTSLSLSSNSLTGNIPSSLGNLNKVYSIVLSQNKLSGKIPPSLGNLSALTSLFLEENSLTGELPASFGKLKALTSLIVNNNKLFEKQNVQFSSSLLPSLNEVEIYDNNYNFNLIEALVKNVHYVGYTNQAVLSIHKNGTTLSVSAGGTLSNNTYYWYQVGQTSATIIPGDSSFHPTQSGQYFANVTNAIATKLVLTTDTITYTAPAVKEPTPVAFSFYPNPVRGSVAVNGLQQYKDGKITITDSYGNIRLTGMARKQSATSFDVSRLQPGIYTITVATGTGIGAKKFVKE